MVLQQEVVFLLQWQDSRLRESPCKAVLSDLLSMSREAANSDLQRNIKAGYQARFWVSAGPSRIPPLSARLSSDNIPLPPHGPCAAAKD